LSFLNILVFDHDCAQSHRCIVATEFPQLCTHYVWSTPSFKAFSRHINHMNADIDRSNGAEHTPFRGVNVKRSIDNSTTDVTLEDYEYVVVGSGPGGAPLYVLMYDSDMRQLANLASTARPDSP